MNHLVIMAGGIGSRFWPMSTPDKPKQFVDVLGTGRTLIQLTVDRFKNICAPEQIWIVTSKNYIDWIHQQLPEIPQENILLEPCMRNTAPCIAYVTWKIKERDPDANLVISPADHVVMDTECFRRVIREGLEFSNNTDRIVTVGIMPHRPETGYGYIKAGTDVEQEHFYKVEAFKEKPSREVAQQYIDDGGYYWNSGIFIWSAKTIEKAFREFQPALASSFDQISGRFYTSDEQVLIDEYYPQCEKISIDYAVMEHADNIYVIPASFGWSDLGTWGSLYELSGKDTTKNAVIGDSIRMIDSENCIVSVPNGKRCILEGLDGYIVVDNNKSLLICKKENEQHIKEWIE